MDSVDIDMERHLVNMEILDSTLNRLRTPEKFSLKNFFLNCCKMDTVKYNFGFKDSIIYNDVLEGECEIEEVNQKFYSSKNSLAKNKKRRYTA